MPPETSPFTSEEPFTDEICLINPLKILIMFDKPF